VKIEQRLIQHDLINTFSDAAFTDDDDLWGQQWGNRGVRKINDRAHPGMARPLDDDGALTLNKRRKRIFYQMFQFLTLRIFNIRLSKAATDGDRAHLFEVLFTAEHFPHQIRIFVDIRITDRNNLLPDGLHESGTQFTFFEYRVQAQRDRCLACVLMDRRKENIA